MSKSFQILVFYVLFGFFAQSINSLETEKNLFNTSQIQSKKYGQNFYSLVEIKVDTNSEYHKNMIVGHNGTLVFTSEFTDNIDIFDRETMDKETIFTNYMIDENQQYLNITCKLWKPENIVLVLCDTNFFEKGFHSVRIGKQSFDYKDDYVVVVEFYGDKEFTFEQREFYLSFMYSAKQNININESQPSYELKFKFNTYFNEILYISGEKENNFLNLDNCEVISNELICKVSKEKIEEILIFKNEQFRLLLMNYTNERYYCKYVYPIVINYENVQKEDIYIKLEKVLGRITEVNTPIAFETNVTEIPNLISNSINIIPNSYESYFKKMTGKKLMLLTKYNYEVENIPIPSIQNAVILDNLHYKYNFIIQPFQFHETITIKNSGALVYFVYPEKIDFFSSNPEIISFEMNTPSLDSGIKLNPDSESYLECENFFKVKRCIVPLSHFNGKKSGDYNIYHKNHAGDSNIYYSLPLINITLPDDITKLYIEYNENKKTKYIGYQGIYNFVLDFNDSITNIFSDSDIEEKTTFETKINVDNTIIINVNCKLWKPIDEKLNMFCKLSKNLTYGLHSFNIRTSSFYYKGQKFIIIQNESLSLFQMNETLPFLYSSKQVINIDENNNTYYLTFKIDEYHKEIFNYSWRRVWSIYSFR